MDHTCRCILDRFRNAAPQRLRNLSWCKKLYTNQDETNSYNEIHMIALMQVTFTCPLHECYDAKDM